MALTDPRAYHKRGGLSQKRVSLLSKRVLNVQQQILYGGANVPTGCPPFIHRCPNLPSEIKYSTVFQVLHFPHDTLHSFAVVKSLSSVSIFPPKRRM